VLNFFKRLFYRFGREEKLDVTKSPKLEIDISAEGYDVHTHVSTAELNERTTGIVQKSNISLREVGEIYQNSSVVRRCADIIGAYCSTVPFRLYEIAPNREETIAYDHFFQRVLEYINPGTTPAMFTREIVTCLALYDEVFVALTPAPQEPDSWGNLPPVKMYLEVLNPTFVQVVPDTGKTGVHMLIYERNGKQVTYRSDRVARITGFSPRDNFRGMLPLDGMVYDLKQEREARNYLSRSYNDQRLKYILTLDPTVGDAKEKRESYRAQLKNMFSTRRTEDSGLVLSGNDKFDQPTLPQVEINTGPTITRSQEGVAMVFGVPVALLLDRSGSKADLEAIELFFWNATLKPLLLLVEQSIDKLVKGLLTSPNPRNKTRYKVGYDYTGVVALKREMFNLTKIAVALTNTGIITPNEARTTILGFPSYRNTIVDENDFGNSIVPLLMAKLGNAAKAAAGTGGTASLNGTSPSLSSTGAEGGRDQSSNGEAQLIDSSGSKSAFDVEITKEALELYFSNVTGV